MQFSKRYFIVGVVLAFAAGCSNDQDHPTSVPVTEVVNVDGSKFTMAEEPPGAMGVITAREEVKDNQPVVIVGRIGGSAKPWIEGRAAFVLADAAALAEACADGHCEAGCTKDCCAHEKELFGRTALVKFVDGQGRALPVDARRLFDVKEKDMVVVRGQAKRDEEGNLTILADGLYIRR